MRKLGQASDASCEDNTIPKFVNYTIHALLAEGSTRFASLPPALQALVPDAFPHSRVYRATDNRTKAPTALKVFARTCQKWFERESQAFCLIRGSKKSCTGILTCYGQGDPSEAFRFLVLEYVSFGTLTAHLTQHGKLPEPIAIMALNQLLRALVFLQECGLVHRDVKPDNLLFDAAKNAIRVIDLGFASVLDAHNSDQTKDENRWGTPMYMSPQLLIADGNPVSLIKSEVWSVGITYWEMILGFCPFFKCKNRWELEQRIEHLDFTGLPPCSRFLLERLLSFHEAQRPTLRMARDLVM